MNRKMMKKIMTIVICFTMILTSFASTVFAASAVEGMIDGSQDFASVPATACSRYEKVSGFAGKESDDTIYSLTSVQGVSPGTSTSVLPVPVNSNTSTKFYEVSFMLTDDSAGIIFRNQIWKTGSGSITPQWEVSTRGFATNVWSDGSRTYVDDVSFETNKWYNLSFVISNATDDSTQIVELYVNGVKKADIDVGSAVSGWRRIQYEPNSNASSVLYGYVDNIRMGGETYDNSINLAPALTVNDSSIISVLQDGTITLAKPATVAQIKNAVTKSDDTTLRIYNGSALLEDSDNVPTGATLVAAAKNGTDKERTYSYYTVGKAIKTFDGILDGSTSLTSGSYTTVETVDGLWGKASDDKVYAFTGNNVTQTAANHVMPFSIIPYSECKQKVFETSFMLPYGSKGFGLIIHKWETADQQRTEDSVYFKPDGIYISYKTPQILNYNFDYNKWYNVAFVIPGQIGDSLSGGTATFYVNGEEIGTLPMLETSGMRRLVICSASTSQSLESPFVYMDNLRLTDTVYSNATYDTVDAVNFSAFDTDAASGKLYITQPVTADDIINDITGLEEDSYITILAADGTPLLGTANVVDGSKVAIAAKNGTNLTRTISYYSVKQLEYDAKIIVLKDGLAAGSVYDNDSSLTFSASFTNYSGETYKPVFYVAIYKGGELIGLEMDNATLSNIGGSDTLTAGMSNMPQNREGTSIKIMLLDSETLMPYTVSKELCYNLSETDTSLYIIGDSVAQSYETPAGNTSEINKSPFIQGWGFWIDNYLNDNVNVVNYARSGWDTDKYLYPNGIYTKADGVRELNSELLTINGTLKSVNSDELYKCWPSIKEEIKAGDYLIIALGINDSGSANVSQDAFRENLSVLCTEAQVLGVNVIFSTPTISGGKWDEVWSFSETYRDYGAIAQSVADTYHATCLPTGATLSNLYNQILADYKLKNPSDSDAVAKNFVRAQFHRYTQVFNASVEDGGFGFNIVNEINDNIHFNDRGAKRLAEVIATLIVNSNSTLKDYIINLND